ncbi:hypothetical protein MJV30_004451 [Salmonella enterica]|nr:hypothetical protein [Salmonella enterica]
MSIERTLELMGEYDLSGLSADKTMAVQMLFIYISEAERIEAEGGTVSDYFKSIVKLICENK